MPAGFAMSALARAIRRLVPGVSRSAPVYVTG
jgi:hypothetical protein